jgi:hypothetical protein
MVTPVYDTVRKVLWTVPRDTCFEYDRSQFEQHYNVAGFYLAPVPVSSINIQI